MKLNRRKKRLIDIDLLKRGGNRSVAMEYERESGLTFNKETEEKGGARAGHRLRPKKKAYGQSDGHMGKEQEKKPPRLLKRKAGHRGSLWKS